MNLKLDPSHPPQPPPEKLSWLNLLGSTWLIFYSVRKMLQGESGWLKWVSLTVGAFWLLSELAKLLPSKSPKPAPETADAPEPEPPIRSLVFLLEEPRQIEDDGPWVQQIGAALGRKLDETKDDATEFIMPMPHPAIPEGTGQCYMLKLREGLFWILNFRKPYLPDPEKFAEQIPDARLQSAVAAHKAWISVDLVACEDSLDHAGIYDLIGKTLSVLAGPDVLALYSPEVNRCNEFDPSLIPALAGGNPLKIFDDCTFAPVVRIEQEDAEMEAAKAEAVRRWPEFVTLFSRRVPNSEDPFIIKAPFSDKARTEFMWVEVRAIEDSLITGILSNTPHQLVGFHEGQTVTLPSDTVVDWLCLGADGKALGGWSAKVLASRTKRSN